VKIARFAPCMHGRRSYSRSEVAPWCPRTVTVHVHAFARARLCHLTPTRPHTTVARCCACPRCFPGCCLRCCWPAAPASLRCTAAAARMRRMHSDTLLNHRACCALCDVKSVPCQSMLCSGCEQLVWRRSHHNMRCYRCTAARTETTETMLASGGALNAAATAHCTAATSCHQLSSSQVVMLYYLSA
jgi:hypothetical protein